MSLDKGRKNINPRLHTNKHYANWTDNSGSQKSSSNPAINQIGSLTGQYETTLNCLNSLWKINIKIYNAFQRPMNISKPKIHKYNGIYI